ncbi:MULTISPECIES: type II toxin-antitoxin system RelE/ParE family toxin [unclassified Gemella]|uniref:type II toxin-antitoxin system RelE family toxin n=1 Tax=unclassified Gemella TaxID=2624949 RepID=UPI0010743058|nr:MULTISPECIES: type II toxin-antitoxin system RelE/ParE family toxin [unclassified Gemella]MBF0710172.1 type II toxin-antitoxin system RelE/ParE family toxin [Gemella sp. GL1.1]MBF0746473.1 type II toxin-antitoxin system RelE/ParE family toxin [Gemella sp. 19428wG2_WT2a]NYS27516.1 type II toxin-antitoxin system RelE/ParE family toxin [Gemella sp. GL1]TFU60253.1 type II toxin-antitoxin system RelE/ParE family toxin [Gemella sp. WT2a]
MYKLEIDKQALKQLKKLDKPVAEMIVRWLYKNVDGITDPRIRGKALIGDKQGLWRYRVGNYRVVCEIIDDRLIVLALGVGHRRNIY